MHQKKSKKIKRTSPNQHHLDLGHKALFALVLSLAISSIIFFQSDTQTGAATGTGSGNLGISLAITSAILNSTDPSLNDTDQNLTAYVESTGNIEIINWYLNDSSITVLHLPFEKVNETNTANYYDYSPNHHQAQENGTFVWNATGGFDGNGTYQFDADNDDRIFINKTEVLNLSQFTLSAWINAENWRTESWRGTIISNDHDASSTVYAGYVLRSGASGTLSFTLRDDVDGDGVYADGDDAWVDVTSSAIMSAKTWHHVAATFDGDTAKIFIDGALQNSQSGVNLLDNPGPVAIGNGYEYQRGFDGAIDQVQIFNVSLTDNQIQAIYNNQTIIHSNQTDVNDTWSFCATPNNNNEDGRTTCSNSLTVQASNRAPVINSNIINSTTPTTNSSSANLTSHLTITDEDGDGTKQIYDWRVNGTSIAPLILPFEKTNDTNTQNTRDYSEYDTPVSEENGIIWNATGGFDGNGSYEFDGVDDYLNVSNDENVNLTGPITIMLWMTTHSNIDVTDTWGMQMIGRGTYLDPDNTMDLRIRAANDEAIFNYEYGAGSNENYAIATTELTDGNWHHVAATWTGDRCLIYTDGVLEGNVSCANTPGPYNESWVIGKSLQPSGLQANFSGSIDDVFIFNRSLSTKQIQAIYNSRTDLIVSQETNGADNWTLCATANDASEDSATVCSSSLEVNALPTIPALVAPTNASSRTNRSVQFEWGTSTDANTDDSITYTLQLFNSSSEFNDLSNVFINQSSIQENSSTDVNYTYFPDLAVDDTFYFRLRASDGKEESAWSELFQFNTLSSNVISLPTSSVSFGEINSSFDKNTTAGSGYQPLIISNDGNIPLNISLNSSQMFTSANSLWQFQVEENETDAYLNANETWNNFTINLNATMHIFNLWHENDSNTANRANLHALVYAAADESAGSKTATIYVESIATE